MTLTIDDTLAGVDAPTDDASRPRSLDLALRRLGFRPRPDRDPARRGPVSSWRDCDAAAPDWRPL